MAELRRYRVIWEIEVDARDPVEAAEAARDIQQDTDSIATAYEIHDCEDAPKIRVFDVDLFEKTCTERRDE